MQQDLRKMRRALARLRAILAEHGTSLGALDASGLNELERGWMRRVREHVQCARLVAVPPGAEPSWRFYARAYCDYLVASGALDVPCTVFVAVGDNPALETCLLRLNTRGQVALITLN